MTRTQTAQTRYALVLSGLLLAAAMAGCVGDDDDDARFASYEEAKAAIVEVFEPADSTSPVRLGLISPEDPKAIGTGTLEVVVLLFDSEADEPITDAEFLIEARMPAMGHGTSPETDPVHTQHGVYIGQTTITMGGQWEVNLNPTLADGTTLEFQVGVTAEGGGEMGDGMHSGDTDGNATSPYASYAEAQAADGEVFSPEEDENTTVRLKLLEPFPRENLTTGETNVTVLLFDNRTDHPITDANATLEAFMPAMGHGTSPETDPVHTQHGVYVGMTTFSMEGVWLLNLEAATGEATLRWSIPVAIGENTSLPEEEGELPEDFNITFEDSFGPGEYATNWTFPVNDTRATISLNITVEGTLGLGGLDSLEVALVDANGTELGSASVSGGESGTIEVSTLETTGEYTITVSGQGGQASYTIEALVAYGA